MITTTTKTTVRETATAVAGALLCTVFALAVSASPARAEAPGKAQIERQLADEATNALPMIDSTPGVATVAVRVDANGRITDSSVVQSSGRSSFDEETLRSARAVRYAKGAPRTVAVVMTFNHAAAPKAEASAEVVSRYFNSRSDTRLADTQVRPQG